MSANHPIADVATQRRSPVRRKRGWLLVRMDDYFYPRLLAVVLGVAWTAYNWVRFRRWRAARSTGLMLFGIGCMAFGLIFAWTAATMPTP